MTVDCVIIGAGAGAFDLFATPAANAAAADAKKKDDAFGDLWGGFK